MADQRGGHFVDLGPERAQGRRRGRADFRRFIIEPGQQHRHHLRAGRLQLADRLDCGDPLGRVRRIEFGNPRLNTARTARAAPAALRRIGQGRQRNSARQNAGRKQQLPHGSLVGWREHPVLVSLSEKQSNSYLFRNLSIISGKRIRPGLSRERLDRMKFMRLGTCSTPARRLYVGRTALTTLRKRRPDRP
jgi:hypothetical protein